MRKEGIYISGGSSNTFIGNDVESSSNLAATDNILLDGNSDNNVINGNYVTDCKSGYGINISAATCNRNIVEGNHVLGNLGGQINDSGTDTHPNGASGTNNLELDDLNVIA